MPESDLSLQVLQQNNRCVRDAGNIVLTVPHSSAHLPHYLDEFAASHFWRAASGTHFASDRSAAALAQAIGRLLKTTDIFEAEFSRLAVDLNRSIDDPSAMPATAGEFGAAPFNPPLSVGDLAARRRYHQNFHRKVEDALKARVADGDAILIDQHSFDRFGEPGIYRSVDIGVCAPADAEFALALYGALAKRVTPRINEIAPDAAAGVLNVRLNEPYPADHPGAYIARRHASARVACAVIEVCDDLLTDPHSIHAIARLIAASVIDAASGAHAHEETNTHA